MGFRTVTVVVVLGAAIPVMPGAGLAASPRTPTVQPATTVVRVDPLDAGGSLRSGYTIGHRYGDASCVKGSAEIGVAYRCDTPESRVALYDPCWVEHAAGSVVCLTKPWSRRVVALHVDSFDNSGGFGKPTRPWGAEPVAPGVRCLLQPAPVVVIDGRDTWYQCNDRVVLAGKLRHVNGAARIWVYQSIRHHDNRYRFLGWKTLRRIWYGRRSVAAPTVTGG